LIYDRISSIILEYPRKTGVFLGLDLGTFRGQKVRNLRRNIPSEILGVRVLPCARLSRRVPKLSPPKNTFIKIPPPVDAIRIFGVFLGISWIIGDYLGNIYEYHTFMHQISGILRINLWFHIKTLWIHFHCHHTILHTPTSILIPSSCFSPSSCPICRQHSTE